MAKAIVGRIGVETCLEKGVEEREAADAAGADRRGSKKERIDDVDCAAAILNRLGIDVATVAHTMGELGDLYMKLYKFAMCLGASRFSWSTDHAISRGRKELSRMWPGKFLARKGFMELATEWEIWRLPRGERYLTFHSTDDDTVTFLPRFQLSPVN